ncbi:MULTISPECIES: hypothetical protein [Methanobacterium]|uniref:Uncharacterized protein n=1 Tax=Methanobacterium subterraneum TaxID=59277 RepID=A0A2H4VB21_9EURY|nr:MULTISPECIES: hypothetical protein [Methanobacterium]AUB55294.1 hypothetical protein BK007_04200 [Methanobacterium subterraneum]AUB57729.1 hypothetical protein BK008_04980 [Methanobacterium sp. MZ-A1]MBW4256302.1 hypothetical protein [Methanobacterium sp. YSL]NMO10201.1 hypothetical protein [Methanobacterium subterraneum]
MDDIEKIDQFIEEVDPSVINELDPKDQVRNVNNLLRTKYQILGVIDDGTDVNVTLRWTRIPLY